MNKPSQELFIPARGATDYTFTIEELFDTRLGQTIFEVYAKHRDVGRKCLIAECSTRSNALELIRRRRGDGKTIG